MCINAQRNSELQKLAMWKMRSEFAECLSDVSVGIITVCYLFVNSFTVAMREDHYEQDLVQNSALMIRQVRSCPNLVRI